MEKFLELLPLLAPLILLQLGLQVFCIVDLIKREKVRFDSKLLWGVVIIVMNILGPVIYLLFGRRE